MTESTCPKRRQRRRCKLPEHHADEHDFETVEEYRARREVANQAMAAEARASRERAVAELAPVVRETWPFIPDAIIHNLVAHGAHPADDHTRLRRHVQNAARHVATDYEALLPPRWNRAAYARLRESADNVVEDILEFWRVGGDH
jgi:hypothetical protein